MLGLRIDADRWMTCRAPGDIHRGEELEDLPEGRDLELPVVLGAARSQLRNAFACAQGLQLRKREILGEPALDLQTIDRCTRLRS